MLKNITVFDGIKLDFGVLDSERTASKPVYITWGDKTKIDKVTMSLRWKCSGLFDIMFQVFVNNQKVYYGYCPPFTKCDTSKVVDITSVINDGKNVIKIDASKSPYTPSWGNVQVWLKLTVQYEGIAPKSSAYVPPWWKYAAYGVIGGAGLALVLRGGSHANANRKR